MRKWNCPVCDRDFEDSEEMDAGICRKCAKYTADIQSACAAGPWRTDVENISPTKWYAVEMKDYDFDYGCIDGLDLIHVTEHIVAFAEFNPPQVTT